jgi:hypothetical protein
MNSPKHDDIDQLVGRAQEKLRQEAQGSPRPGGRKPFVGVRAIVFAWLAAITLWAWQLWHSWS